MTINRVLNRMMGLLHFYYCGKFLHDRIISLTWKDWTHKTSLTPPLFLDVSVPSQESERPCVCGIVVASFCEFSNRFCKCSKNMPLYIYIYIWYMYVQFFYRLLITKLMHECYMTILQLLFAQFSQWIRNCVMPKGIRFQ